MPIKRSFEVEWSEWGFKGGRYTLNVHRDPKKANPGPLSAAKKAARAIFDAHPSKGSEVKFQLREMTRGSGAGEGAFYKGKKVKLSPPRKKKINGKEITFAYEYSVHPSSK
jgi:hypothetical protein